MPQKPKAPPGEKITAVEAYLRGELGSTEAIRKFGINMSTWRMWIRLYETRGAEGLIPSAKLRRYSAELKMQVVQEYLIGRNSLRGLCKKYSISHATMVQAWIKQYNGQKRFKNPKSGRGIYMAKGRKTTMEERVQAVSHCITNGKDYSTTAEKYQVSYQQLYSWVHKYEKQGIGGLNDKRGKRKLLENMTVLERLQAENKLLRAENKHKEMEIEILKKVQEVERRRG